jgi:hypothetical protein
MATKNEDQTKYSHLSKVLENVKKNPYIINQNHIVNLTDAPAPIAGRYWRERKCVARRTVRGDTQKCL